MSRARKEIMSGQSRFFDSRFKGWLKRAGHWLYRYRPRFRDWRFWVVQGLVIAIGFTDDVLEFRGLLSHYGALYFVPVALLFVPVIYAALNFGFVGSITTALWAMITTIPDFAFAHNRLELGGIIFQSAILISMAVIIGRRVDRERNAWHRVEAASAKVKSSEIKYRGVFESSPVAILVLNPNGTILDANPAAGILFGKTPKTLKGMTVADLVGTENGLKLLGPLDKDQQQELSLTFNLRSGEEVYLEPMRTQISDSQGNIITQVLLRDVTQERHRQAGLKAFTSHIVHAQEQERQRIARELHDETIQTLILLCRRLDSVENTSSPLPSPVIEELRGARKIAEKVVKGLRDFAKSLRPPILDDLGVVASIRRLVVDITQRTGINGKLKLVGEERQLPQETRLGMYRIAQEALWNVEHHSRATEVVVSVTFAEYEVGLDVNDNGAGFDVSFVLGRLSAADRLGLLGMEERAELLGGKFEIQSSPGKGTKVTISIPMSEGTSQAFSP